MSSNEDNSSNSNSPLSPSSSTPTTDADAETPSKPKKDAAKQPPTTTGTNNNNTDPQTKSVSQDLRAGALDSSDLETLDAKKLTKFYRVPNARFKTAQDIIKFYGYELGEKIAEGGFGLIYKATHLKTKVEVACKQMDMNKSKCLNHLESCVQRELLTYLHCSPTKINPSIKPPSYIKAGRRVEARHQDGQLKGDGHEE